MSTPYESLTKANDDYHEAFDEVLMDRVLPSEVKAKFGKYVIILFDMMKQADELIKPYYEVIDE